VKKPLLALEALVPMSVPTFTINN
jgi:hypothetical protein